MRQLRCSLGVVAGMGLVLLLFLWVHGLALGRYATESVVVNWTDPQLVSAVTDCSDNPKVAVDRNGTLHAIWVLWADFVAKVYYSYKPLGGGWTSPVVVFSSPRYLVERSIAAAGAGNVHVLLSRAASGYGSELIHLSKAAGGAWTSEVPVSFPNGSVIPTDRTTIFAGENIVHILFNYQWTCGDSDYYHSFKTNGGTWSKPTRLTTTSGHEDRYTAVLDGAGRVHLVYTYGYPGYYQLLYATWSASSGWTAPVKLRDVRYQETAKLAVDRQNRLHLVWSDSLAAGTCGIYHTSKAAGGSWSAPDQLPWTGDTPSCPGATAMTADSAGTLYVFMGAEMSARGPDGTWSPPSPLPSVDSYGDQLVPGLARDLHLVRCGLFDYQAYPFDYRIVYLHGERAPATPTPTPPAASANISPDGGSLAHHYEGHTTLMTVPAGAITTTATFTISYVLPPTNTWPLAGMDHFFALDGSRSAFSTPLTMTIFYSDHVRGPIVADTRSLYRWEAGWTTVGITLTDRSPGRLASQISGLSLYGVLGESRRMFLPAVMR